MGWTETSTESKYRPNRNIHRTGSTGGIEERAQPIRRPNRNIGRMVELIDWLIDYLTLADCNNPARGQKQEDIRTENEQETERKKQANKQTY